MGELPAAALRVEAAAREKGLAIDIVVMAQGTRTAEEAAAACGCEVGQIVKSLVFRGEAGGGAVLLLVSGRNRVDEAVAAAAIGEKLTRPDARFVREATGFAIGGIPPLGHAKTIATYMDRDLLEYATVWAAGGTPSTIFSVDPGRLAEATAATVIAVR